jgi:hypothetical protein
MNLELIARAYVSCVELEERAGSEASQLAEELASLRADLHAVLMDALRQSKISFADRQEASRIAFEIIRRSSTPV